MFADCIEKFKVGRNQRISPEDKKNSGLHCYFGRIALLVHYHEVHEGVAEQEEQPLPGCRGLPRVEPSKVERSAQRLALWPRPAIGERVVYMCLCFLKALSFTHIFDEVPGEADDIFGVVESVLVVDNGALVLRIVISLNHAVELTAR